MTHELCSEADLKHVDVIFLDIDGVLLPFGDVVGKPTYTDGCIFPDRNMDALTELLQKMSAISPAAQASADSNADSIERRKLKMASTIIEGNPVLVLSSTWRARPEFIADILSSFRSYTMAHFRHNQWIADWKHFKSFSREGKGFVETRS